MGIVEVQIPGMPVQHLDRLGQEQESSAKLADKTVSHQNVSLGVYVGRQIFALNVLARTYSARLPGRRRPLLPSLNLATASLAAGGPEARTRSDP